MKWRHWTFGTTWILLALVLLGTTAFAQQQDLPAVFSDAIDVRVVNVEVVVTDRKGNRVHGLKASDFELLVDGEPTPIDYFTEIKDGLAKETGDDVAAVPNLNANAHVATNYLIYIDDVFSIQQDRDLVLTRLEEDLRELHSTDRVAAVAFDGKSMETLTGWTNSREGLAEALDRARAGHVAAVGPRHRRCADDELPTESSASANGRGHSNLLLAGLRAHSAGGRRVPRSGDQHH